ncbi:MAG: hypothetical protein IJX77_07520 [Ruminococcus sp.]|nr:hypothetical protein [Ruminococcus sp.]
MPAASTGYTEVSMDIKRKLIIFKTISRILWFPVAAASMVMLVDSFIGMFWEHIRILSVIAIICELISFAGIFLAVYVNRESKRRDIKIGMTGLAIDCIMRQVFFFASFTLDWLLYIGSY